MKPITFDSMRKAAKAIGIGYAAIRYARDNGKNYVKRFEDVEAHKNVKVFFIKWH